LIIPRDSSIRSAAAESPLAVAIAFWSILTIRSALPLLQSGASIVVNGSIAETVGFPPGAGSYSASKGGMHAMIRAMAVELSPLGIRINVVSPGPIKTPLSLPPSLPRLDCIARAKLNGGVEILERSQFENESKVRLGQRQALPGPSCLSPELGWGIALDQLVLVLALV
jgi:NAD(P)-dependent dehydrogenase (short-subunit alcohol dehydrogenase family)